MPMTNKGLSKLTEELGELLQEVGKTMAVGNDIDAYHWSGNLRDRIQTEMGDVLAAIGFVIDKLGLDGAAIEQRSREKYVVFNKWDAEEPEPATMPLPTPQKEPQSNLLYCLGCACIHPSEYMTTPDVWTSAGLDYNAGALCLKCLEARVGRPLTLQDFPDVPINGAVRYGLSTAARAPHEGATIQPPTPQKERQT